MEWAVFGALFVFGVVVLGIIADFMRQRRKMQQQELLQKERLMAMEQGVPLPEWNPALLADDAYGTVSPEVHERRLQFFRFIVLCLGVVLAFGGVGMGIGFGMSMETDLRKLASVGAIPFMTGLGLLLFYFLTRNRNA
jgi:hypothetical protein